METHIPVAMIIYSIDVTKYNTYIYSFPSSIIANLFHFEEAELFEAEEDSKENPSIS